MSCGVSVTVDVGDDAMTVGDAVGVDDSTTAAGDTTCTVGVNVVKTSI